MACRGYDSFMSSDTDMCARLATGSSVDLVNIVLNNNVGSGLGLVSPTGHNAMADTPYDFCGYNKIVIASHSALNRGLKRVLYMCSTCQCTDTSMEKNGLI